MRTSIVNEIKRWALQLLMVFASPFYTASVSSIIISVENKPGAIHTFLLLLIFSLHVAYYALSVYVHYRHDRVKLFTTSPILSVRSWILIVLSALFLVAAEIVGQSIAPNCRQIYNSFYAGLDPDGFFSVCNPFLLFPLCSIVLTWWLSELYVRLKHWQSKKQKNFESL
jgi:hypothetical protein